MAMHPAVCSDTSSAWFRIAVMIAFMPLTCATSVSPLPAAYSAVQCDE
jgi:hypothetical protein